MHPADGLPVRRWQKMDDLHISALHGTAMNLATEMGWMADAVTELRELAGR
jgi:hypothetical protein